MTEEHGAHPDIETLDAYLDAHLDAHPDAHLDAHPGLSDPGRSRGAVASRADRHIRACATCQETLAALRRVRGELARLATMTMPDEVAERIHAALAARSGTAAGRADGGSPLDAFGAAATHRDHDHEHEHEYGEYGEYGEQGDRRAAGLWRGPGGGSPARFRGAGTGGPRGRRGRPGSPGRAARDWVSIAATCLALVAFGAAVLAVRGLTAGGAGSADATASSPVAASAPPGGDIVVRPDSAAAPTAAGTRSLSVPPGGTSVLVADSDMILRPSDVVPHGQELLAGRLAPTWFGWSDADPDAGSWLAPGTDSMEQPAEAAGRFREQGNRTGVSAARGRHYAAADVLRQPRGTGRRHGARAGPGALRRAGGDPAGDFAAWAGERRAPGRHRRALRRRPGFERRPVQREREPRLEPRPVPERRWEAVMDRTGICGDRAWLWGTDIMSTSAATEVAGRGAAGGRPPASRREQL
ncbi:hypothetical protein [Frankia sp. EI5c]|uniref:hypothetical protein n=1 Tax=Frankia sp. EI5c TaxID=683316 RepID=UPI000FF8A676|nr:hypothetical protein [Frankia sp. EI5c]